MKIKTLIVDDHVVLRSGLRQTLEQMPNFEVVGEAASGIVALKMASELKPELIFMDIHLPDLNGIEVSRRILKDDHQAKIIIFSSDCARELIDEALEAGVCGYVAKSTSTEQLTAAIDAVLQGKLYLSPELSSDILGEYKSSLLEKTSTNPSHLSELDRQVIRLITQGMGNKDISERLGMTPKAVEAYRARLMKRLGFSKSADLIRYAIREGIAEP